MPSQSISPESWIGKLVWVFLRDDAGLPISRKAECGVVVDTVKLNFYFEDSVWVVQVGDNYYHVWHGDMEIVEDWDEEVEGENGSLETTGERTRTDDRDSLE